MCSNTHVFAVYSCTCVFYILLFFVFILTKSILRCTAFRPMFHVWVIYCFDKFISAPTLLTFWLRLKHFWSQSPFLALLLTTHQLIPHSSLSVDLHCVLTTTPVLYTLTLRTLSTFGNFWQRLCWKSGDLLSQKLSELQHAKSVSVSE